MKASVYILLMHARSALPSLLPSAPQYIPGKVSVLVTLALAAGVAMWLRMLVSRANAAKREQISALKAQHGWDDEEVARQRDAWAFRDLTDRQNPFFVYSS